MLKLNLALSALLLAGCASEGKTKRYVVLGIGVVKVSAASSVEHVSTKALGLVTGPRGAALGYVSQTVTEIQTNANVYVEIRKNRITILPIIGSCATNGL